MPAGQKLKTLRNNRNITVREVEQASRRIAEVKADKKFFISNGWLAQLENGDLPGGERRIRWSASGQPAGIGFLELQVDGERVVQRIVMLP